VELVDRERGDAHAGDIGFGRHRAGKVDRWRGERSRVARIGTGHDGGQERGIVDAAREGAQRIERGRERHNARQADHAISRLESGQSAQS